MFHYVKSKKRNTKAWFQNPNVSLIIHILNYMAVSEINQSFTACTYIQLGTF